MDKIRTSIVRFAGAVALLFVMGACGTDAPPATVAAAAGEIGAGDVIPAPESKPILAITGLISESNHSKGIRLDMETLEDMPIVEATIYEPFLKENVKFSGVMMDDLLEIVGVDPDAAGVRMTALDDFVADLPMSELTSGTVLLATRQDGKPLKVRAGGPSRIVFLNDKGMGSNPDSWIWSVATMDVHV